MSNENFLKDIKKKAYLHYHQDGLLELIVGICLLGFALLASVGTDSTLFGWVILLIYPPLKNQIAVPRLGYVIFSEPKNNSSKFTSIIFLTVFALSVGIMAGYFVSHNIAANVFYEENAVVISSSLSAVIFLGMWMLTKIDKFLLYAGLNAAVIAFSLSQNIHPGIYLSAISFILIGAGLINLRKFIKKYPILDEDGLENHE